MGTAGFGSFQTAGTPARIYKRGGPSRPDRTDTVRLSSVRHVNSLPSAQKPPSQAAQASHGTGAHAAHVR